MTRTGTRIFTADIIGSQQPYQETIDQKYLIKIPLKKAL